VPALERILVWSPTGFGGSYSGPGRAAHSLYAHRPDGLDVVGVHGIEGDQPADFPIEQLAGNVRTTAGQVHFIRSARRWLAEHAIEFDVFHGFTAWDFTTVPALHAHRAGLPAVVRPASHNADLATKHGLRRLVSRAHRRRSQLNELDGVIALTHAIKDELVGYGVDEAHIAVIPNSVDTRRFTPTAPSERAAQREALGLRDAPVVLFVGKLFERKRPDLAIAAFARIRASVPAQLVLVGPSPDDEQERRLQQQVSELGLDDAVTFVGAVADPVPWFRAADVFVLPSEREGLANVLVEAAASGLPVVTCETPGVRDAVDDQRTGTIVGSTIEEVADALRAYLADPALAEEHGRAGRLKAETEFARPAILRAHLELFDRILTGGRPAG